MRRERGWTMIELVVSLGVISAVAAVAAALTHDARRTADLASQYETDVTSMRRALAAVEADIRCARDVRADAASLVASTDAAEVDWRLASGALVRAGTVVARNVAAFEASRRGDVVDVTIELGRRSNDATRAARVTTAVRLRAPREDAR